MLLSLKFLDGYDEKPSGMIIAEAVKLFAWLKSLEDNPKGFWSKFRICVKPWLRYIFHE